jgi:RNA polymerase sigma factor (sigma-70 family)
MARSEVQSELQLYLREVNETPLLTPDEEKTLGWRIINDGCLQSKERMIKANLRLVIAISKNYVNRGLTLPDLIEEGNIGLIRAVEGFDPAQGARFSTYASWWIKQAIKRTLINAVQPIHIPAYMVELIARWKDTSRKFEEKHGRSPSLQELSKEMKLPVKKLVIIRRAVKAYQAPSQAPLGEDGVAMDFGDLFEDTRGKQLQDHPQAARLDRRARCARAAVALRPRGPRAAHAEADRRDRRPDARTRAPDRGGGPAAAEPAAARRQAHAVLPRPVGLTGAPAGPRRRMPGNPLLRTASPTRTASW